MKKSGNPFAISGYLGSEWFCDREKELLIVQQHINNNRNIVLYALRRMGKSALISHFFEETEFKNSHDHLYVDLLATQNMKQAIEAITTAVHEKYGKSRAGITASLQKLFSRIGAGLSFDPVTGMPEISFSVKNPLSPEKSLKELGEFLKSRKKQVIIAFDEFQQITSYSENNAEAVFRTWIQELPHIRFIFSGSHRKMMTSMFKDSSRPFYQSAQLLSLGPIPLESYKQFITNHFEAGKKKISSQHIGEIYNWANGQTYAIQLICNYLYAQYKTVTSEAIREVISQILDQEAAVFAGYQKLLTKIQWNVLRAIAHEEAVENPTSKDFINKYQLGSTSSIKVAFSALEKKELIIYDNNSYRIHDVIFSRWLKTV